MLPALCPVCRIGATADRIEGSVCHIALTNHAQQFASDNYAGICPEVWDAMAEANHGHATAYGEDSWTERASNAFRDLFETDCEVFFVFNGTAANSLALASLCQSYHSVICTQMAHVETDECGAPEFFSNGSKLLTAASPDGKLTPEAVRSLATSRTDIHFPAAQGGDDHAIDRNRAASTAIRRLVCWQRRRAPMVCTCIWMGRAFSTRWKAWAARRRR